MCLKFLFHGFRKMPERHTLWRIEDFTTAETRDCEYGASLGEIMCAWEPTSDGRRSQKAELPTRIPPPSEIHLANPGDD